MELVSKSLRGVAVADRAEAGVSKSYRNYVLGLLLVVGIFSWVDRQIFSILMQSIKQEFAFTDTQLGLLGGFAFGIFYASVGLPIAWLADRYNRRNIISLAIGLWSCMTAFSGLATGFGTLFLARMGVGIGEAGGAPPSQSLISDYFPPERRAFALGVLYSYMPLGSLVAFLCGGWANEYLGWRAAFLVVGIPGILVALLVRLTLREPIRGASERIVQPSVPLTLPENLRYLLSRPSLRHLALAGALHGVGAFGAAVWMPTYFIRQHGMSSAEIGTWLALVLGFAGLAGTLLGGHIGDRLVQKTGDARWYPWLICTVILATLPLLVFVYSLPPVPALLLFIVPTLLQNMMLGPVTATIQNLAGVRRRAMAAAMYLFLTNLIAMGCGPLLVGVISDAFALTLGTDSLRYGLLATMVISTIWAAFHFWMASRELRKDLAEAGVQMPGQANAT